MKLIWAYCLCAFLIAAPLPPARGEDGAGNDPFIAQARVFARDARICRTLTSGRPAWEAVGVGSLPAETILQAFARLFERMGGTFHVLPHESTPDGVRTMSGTVGGLQKTIVLVSQPGGSTCGLHVISRQLATAEDLRNSLFLRFLELRRLTGEVLLEREVMDVRSGRWAQMVFESSKPAELVVDSVASSLMESGWVLVGTPGRATAWQPVCALQRDNHTATVMAFSPSGASAGVLSVVFVHLCPLYPITSPNPSYAHHR